jgi:hypothetical protein
LTGQLWSSSLNEIATIIGRNTLDQLLLESYYAFSSNLSFQQMAEILMVTDSLLYGGKYHFALCHCFTLRGFINGNCYNGQVSVNEREKPCMRVDHNTLYISNLPDEKWNLSISDLQGKSIYYNRFEGRTISTTHLFASGIYLVTLDSDNGFSYTQKLIMIE